eukprot:7187046-Prymnesium_polylepis.1
MEMGGPHAPDRARRRSARSCNPRRCPGTLSYRSEALVGHDFDVGWKRVPGAGLRTALRTVNGPVIAPNAFHFAFSPASAQR